MFLRLLVVLALSWQQHASAFAPSSKSPSTSSFRTTTTTFAAKTRGDDDEPSGRRSFLTTTGCALMGALSISPKNAWAGIDVSGLRVEGGSGGNPALASQLKAYDGSGSTRIREIKTIQEESYVPTKKISSATAAAVDNRDPIATWAYRANPGFNPTLTRVGPIGNLYRYNDMVQAPVGSKRRALGVQFEFPADWLQLDRTIGGIQYVDQRNGDKLYVFRAPLPADTTLETVSKATIGDYIFDPEGSLAKSGQTIEEYKVSSAQMLSDCQVCAPRRRFKVKYATVTGNGLRVERRALVDAYQVENDVYMLMTSSNAVKFEQKDSLERETVENIVASFQVDV